MLHPTQLLHQLQLQGAAFARAIPRIDPAAPVPSCPDWAFEDLVRHLIRVHRWAEQTLSGQDPTVTAESPTGPDLEGEFEAGLARMLSAIRGAPRPVRIPTPFSDLPPREFWTRRMAHDTTMHRIDAELTADTGMIDVDPDLAADGIDELVSGFAPARFPRTGLALDDRTMLIMPLDANRVWTVTLNRAFITTSEHPVSNPDLTVSGMASDLYRWVWNRAYDREVQLTGNLKIASWWHRHGQVDSGQMALIEAD